MATPEQQRAAVIAMGQAQLAFEATTPNEALALVAALLIPTVERFPRRQRASILGAFAAMLEVGRDDAA